MKVCIIQPIAETARRCNAMVFVNARSYEDNPDGRNTAHAFDQAMIDKAHENGIICNVFWSDDEEETQRFLDMRNK